jgi:DNA-directed RNA polymerase beta subunit
MSAINEADFIIAQASASVDEKGFLSEELVSVRYQGEFSLKALMKSIYGCLSRNKLFRLLRH